MKEVERLVRDADARTKSVEEIKTFLTSTSFRDDLEQHVFGSNAILSYVFLGSEAIGGTESLALSGWGISINEPEFTDVHNVRLGDAAFIEPGHFTIVVEFTTSCRIDYCASYTDYMNLSIAERDTIGERSVSGDGVVDLCEQREVRLEGFVDLYFSPDCTVSEIKVHSQYLAVRSPKIRAELNVERGTIL
ncbi:hypothetical protein [Caballeronia sp. LZ043]|uniref:hypothetical protein n=1 Tax=Caballeronia sp. LZ043 TaxID=3038569 RepID=UPI00286381D4|nr:hypothetical protein [Caballeronia sp. LZ043]MDR5826119.1 hypothetical protein [Caballeronia sp. LZ043]